MEKSKWDLHVSKGRGFLADCGGNERQRRLQFCKRDDSMNALSSDLEFAESESERESLHGGRVSRVE